MSKCVCLSAAGRCVSAQQVRGVVQCSGGGPLLPLAHKGAVLRCVARLAQHPPQNAMVRFSQGRDEMHITSSQLKYSVDTIAGKGQLCPRSTKANLSEPGEHD